MVVVFAFFVFGVFFDILFRYKNEVEGLFRVVCGLFLDLFGWVGVFCSGVGILGNL